ncbi:hypothetical protein [Actibacterium sp. 188UL27-1]|uniref:hypothetical protein n=1 Tax=Actibacterium sp. 188UL27-1 TaxID=2786961 RepID=UPI00195B00B5|nr:hypothetical protein [Actibacterium sp. 188UL27-1]MBM7068858.1 hypothetical protein [Actibacterium sp. 188UL27-1]
MLTLPGLMVCATGKGPGHTATEFEVDGPNLFTNGDIDSDTLGAFRAIIDQNPNIRRLVECDMPGSLDDDTMIALAYQVRRLGLETYLTSTSDITSGAADLFLAGTRRTMERSVHSWSDGERDAINYPRGSPEHEQNRVYVKTVLGSDAFYWFTIQAAPFDGMHQMTQAEIRRFGLLTRSVMAAESGSSCSNRFYPPPSASPTLLLAIRSTGDRFSS